VVRLRVVFLVLPVVVHQRVGLVVLVVVLVVPLVMFVVSVSLHRHHLLQVPHGLV